ncbi:MAG: AtpZ/AtpI family protein [Candidatus Saccharimonadales bacterium]
MKQTTAPKKTPSPNGGTSPVAAPTADTQQLRTQFLMAALNMSWQLAIVVLVPIVGGFELDKLFGTLPALTIIGFIAAMIGMGLVVWRQMQLYSPQIPAAPSKPKGKQA